MSDNTITSTDYQHDAKTVVLVVEDDENIGSFLAQVLMQETPYHPLLFTDGAHTLEAVKTLKPDLFILDYHLPGMNGLELYDHLHAQPELASIPAILISAGQVARSELRKRNIPFLSKPIELADFLEAVEKSLGNREE